MDGVYYNLRAERAIIASLSKKGVAEKYISRLTPDDFYDADNASLFKAMQRVFMEKRSIDYVLLASELMKMYGNDNLMSLFFEIAKTGIGAEVR